MKTINNTTTNPTTDTTTFSLGQLRKGHPRTVRIEDIDPEILASWVRDVANAELESLKAELESLKAELESLKAASEALDTAIAVETPTVAT